ncbi:hypothetical protein HETIRDRAFT_377546 [Heterobasidion irregulare TC 32-1]|uniref:ARID domain-containing protein n=1 Tax=Heterobasidion irregulare (strain TC 32-1) TaxID=747525 RepID=W4KMH4_HETIT|nr:uncharacterized protein HETIRDRAFT_377546 [Heterobasidion irregulare TC 32-1]ETW86899.1 hypothetical protein HETIRDRAFT_377546 [Heterobasidion irregulare TC 32-1]
MAALHPRALPPQNTHPINIPAYRSKHRQFLASLAGIHAARNTPLPPALTGIPNPAFDPLLSSWTLLDPSPTEPGSIRLAGRLVDLFKLWTTVHTAGGGAKFTQQGLWPSVLPVFDLPDTLPPPNSSQSVAEFLGQVYMAVVLPFEDVYRRNSREQQQRALQAAAQGALNPQQQQPFPSPIHPRVPSQPILPPVTSAQPSPQLSRQLSASAVPGTPQQSFTALPPVVDLNPGPPLLPYEANAPFDPDLESRKRKIEPEDEQKRTRQKTSGAPAGVLPQPSPSTPARGQPQRRKIEYVPTVREIGWGGRDVPAIAEEHARASTRRILRDLNEWGSIEVDALAMSVRSRIATELSYALTTLTILSTMRGANGNGFSASICPDLVDELLDLVADVALGGVEAELADAEEGEDAAEKITTHKELVNKVLEDGSRPFAALDRKQGAKPEELGHKQRPGDLVLAVMNILRNLSVFPENQEFLARHERALPYALRLCGLGRGLQPVSPALSLTDLVAVRRDTLYLLVNLAPHVRLASSLSATPSPTAARLAQRTFALVSSFLVDPFDAVTPLELLRQSDMVPGGPVHPPPALVDAALEVFTRLGQPDANRRVIARSVPLGWQRRLFEALVHRMPVAEPDFAVALRDHWLAYVAKVVMALYALAFLAPPRLKAALRADRTLDAARVLLRLVRRFTVAVPDALRGHARGSALRATEALRALDEEEDAFDGARSTAGPVLAFGVGYGEVGEDRVETGTGLLGGFQDEVVFEIMMAKDMENDMFKELDSLARVG